MSIVSFSAPNGWLDRFKERQGINFKKVCEESNSVNSNSDDMTKWSKLKPFLDQYSPCDILNADETGIFYQLTPDKTLEFENVQCHGGKKSKSRLTALVCANMSGTEKLPMLSLRQI